MQRDDLKEFSDETLLVHLGEDRAAYHGAVVPPLFQNSLFTFESWDALEAAFNNRTEVPIYSRGCNPTVALAEQKIAAIARGDKAKLFGSGMAAIAASIMHCVAAGDHVVAVNNMYGPARNLLSDYLGNKLGIDVTFVHGDVSEFEDATQDNTRLYYLESPSSVVFGLQDLAAVAVLARRKGVKTIVDNSWASPVFQKPLKMGIDIEVHTASKYLGGHSDIIGGVAIASAQIIEQISTTEFELFGGIISPFNAWLIIRSLRTLPMRMRRHEGSSIEVARFLETRKEVSRVLHPGLPSHPQHKLAKKQMTGFGGLFGFTLATTDPESVKEFFDSLRLFKRGVSWGGHESLIYAPAISYAKEMTNESFEALGLRIGDMRVSIGFEDPSDLISDLRQALEKLG